MPFEQLEAEDDICDFWWEHHVRSRFEHWLHHLATTPALRVRALTGKVPVTAVSRVTAFRPG